MHEELFVGFARSPGAKHGRCICLDAEGERVLDVRVLWSAKALSQMLDVIGATSAAVYVGLQVDDLDGCARRALRRLGCPARVFFGYAVDAQALGIEHERFTARLRARCVAQLLFVRRHVDARTALAWCPGDRRDRVLPRGNAPGSRRSLAQGA